MSNKTISIAKLASAANTLVTGGNIGSNIVTFNTLAINESFFASNSSYYFDVSPNVAANSLITVSREIDTEYSKYGAHFINSNVSANSGRTIWSQDYAYGLGLHTTGTGTSTAKAKFEWVDLETGLVQSTPLELNFDGTVSISGSSTSFSSPVSISVSSSSDALRVTQTGSGNALLVEDSTNPDSTPFIITANGDVGIGTSSPNSKLDIVGDGQITLQGGGANNWINFIETNWNDRFGIGVNFAGVGDLNRLFISSNSNFGTPSFADAKVVVNQSGNVGIGITTPADKLHVSGNIIANSINVAFINASRGNTTFNGNLIINSIGTTSALIINSSGSITTVDPSNRLIRASNVALSTAINGTTQGIPGIQNHSINVNDSSIGIYGWLDSAVSTPLLTFSKSDVGAIGTHQEVAAGSGLGAIAFNGSDGSIFVMGARIVSQVEGFVSAGVVPSNFIFTTRNVGGTFAERARITANGDLRFDSGYGSSQNAYGVRAWVNFDSTGNTANLFGNFVQNSGNLTGTVSNTRIYVTTNSDHGLIAGSQINVAYQTGDSNLAFALRTVTAVVSPRQFYYANTTAGYPAGGSTPGLSFRSGTVYLERELIRGSGSVSSITDLSVGTKIINFSYALVDANYSVVGAAGNLGTVGIVSTSVGAAPDADFVRVRTVDMSNTATDFSYNNIIVVR